MNEFFFQIEVSQEQVAYTQQLVEYSITHHTVADIFQNDPSGKERQRAFRFTGTLGEVVFADAYKLPRPQKSFGAADGQDYGQDFVLEINGKKVSLDIKSMQRKNNYFKKNYVLNLPKYQIDKGLLLTDYYFCISIHEERANYIASFIGYIEKEKIQKNEVGILYKAGTKRIKDNGDFFVFQRDTYEIDFKDISSPFLDVHIKALQGFQLKKLL